MIEGIQTLLQVAVEKTARQLPSRRRRSGRAALQRLAVEFVCLLAGLKTAVLVDQGLGNDSCAQLLFFVAALEERGRDLVVVELVDYGLFVLNRTTVERATIVSDENKVFVVLASSGLSTFPVMDRGRDFERRLRHWLGFSVAGIGAEKRLVNWSLVGTGLCCCALAGILLEYPVIYRIGLDREPNNLANEDLTVYSVAIRHGDEHFPIAKFSVPLQLLDSISSCTGDDLLAMFHSCLDVMAEVSGSEPLPLLIQRKDVNLPCVAL